jgi:hypothetical protein
VKWDEAVKVATESALRNKRDVFIHQDFSKRYEAYYTNLGQPVELYDDCERTILTVAVVRADGWLESCTSPLVK